MRRRPARPRCLRGSIRTEARRAASVLPRPLTSRRGQLNLNRPCLRRGLESAKANPPLRRGLALSQNQNRQRTCKAIPHNPFESHFLFVPGDRSEAVDSSTGVQACPKKKAAYRRNKFAFHK